VGNGPFPTELQNSIGDRLRTTGGEYGATTGRPRRCGWLDLISLKYSLQINGIQELALTKIDVLDDFDEIQVATGYELDHRPLRSYPSDIKTLETVNPVYRRFRGWNTKISDVRKFSRLPLPAQRYIRFIEKEIGVPIKYVSVGARRDQTIAR
jgi:adenylosuccinate synthase